MGYFFHFPLSLPNHRRRHNCVDAAKNRDISNNISGIFSEGEENQNQECRIWWLREWQRRHICEADPFGGRIFAFRRRRQRAGPPVSEVQGNMSSLLHCAEDVCECGNHNLRSSEMHEKQRWLELRCEIGWKDRQPNNDREDFSKRETCRCSLEFSPSHRSISFGDVTQKQVYLRPSFLFLQRKRKRPTHVRLKKGGLGPLKKKS